MRWRTDWFAGFLRVAISAYDVTREVAMHENNLPAKVAIYRQIAVSN